VPIEEEERIYHWDVGLVVTGLIRDIGQHVLQSAFVTGSSSSRHIIIILCINYTM